MSANRKRRQRGDNGGIGIPASLDFLAGEGVMHALMRSLDWSKTSLGPPEGWPQSLRSAISICLGSSFPIAIYWGRELALLYNDAWSPIAGDKHPWALGRPGREVWPEIWDTIGPSFQQVMATGKAAGAQDQLLPMHRHGYIEECYFNYTLAPIRGEGGRVEGIFNAVIETTYRVIGERRARILRDFTERTATARSGEDACALAVETLGTATADVPFCLLYLLDADKSRPRARLAGAAGLAPGGPASPASIDLSAAAELPIPPSWPIDRVAETGRVEVVNDLTARFGTALPGGTWPEPAECALVVPIASAVHTAGLSGFLVAGLSPRRALDDEYRDFFELLAAKITTAVGHARAYEEERRRAEELAQLDHMKALFFSNISHEFRTPLSLMLGPIEEVLDDASIEISEIHRTRLEIAHRNALRLLKLVNSLLDFSRIEAGRAQACFEPTDLAEFTTELASNFRSLCESAGLRFVVDCPRLAEPVYVDRDMWEKIVLNLVSNAFKFTFDGEIVVSIRNLDEDHVEFAVRDTGTGIPAYELPSLFLRFHRIEGARRRSFEGSGIGLALVHELTKLHGGTLSVESEVDQGSIFRVGIPLGNGHLSPEQIRPSRVIASQHVRTLVEEARQWLPRHASDGPPMADQTDWDRPGPGADGSAYAIGTGRPQVVLAEDNADMRAFIGRILEDGGCAVRGVADGAAALEAVRHSAPDLVLTDVMMPRLDGFGLLRALRADPATQHLSVLMLSTRAGEEAKIEGLAAGADGYLIKPFSSRELMAHVDGAVRLARLRREATDREAYLRSRWAVSDSEAQRLELEHQLRQSQKMDAVGQLTGGIAHDFNNILTVIIGIIEILVDGVADRPQLAAIAAMIDQAATRGAELTRLLLAFARKQPLQPRPTDINALVIDTARLLRPALGEHIEIGSLLAGNAWLAMVDRAQLSNALINLAVNARDAMPGGGKLTLETTNVILDESYGRTNPDAKPGHYVMIAVSDNGVGIPATLHDKVFEPFFTTKDVGKGTGLGLSMVYGFIRQSDGHIKIYSELGHGTTVKLYMPRSSVEAAEPDAPLPAAVQGGSETILVVEDDPLVRSQVVAQLASLGYAIASATDGVAALAMVDQGVAFDLLFTDMVLPGGITGRQLAAEVARRRPSLRVLYTSGYTEDAMLHHGRIDPGIGWLSKPYRKADLARRIREVLDAAAGSRPT
jgi:signal transduction histidine kinase